MQLILLSDIHSSTQCLPAIASQLQEADLVLIAGDITNFGTASAAAKVIHSIAAFNSQILAVSGNCDPTEIDIYLNAEGMGLHADCRQRQDIDFIGVSGALPCPGSSPEDSGEAHFQSSLKQGLGQRLPGNHPLVLVSHQPAYGTDLDQTMGGGHAGSTALRDFIDQQNPILAVSGHIHESPGIDHVGPCTLVNPGPFNTGRFARIQIEDQHVSVALDRVT